MPAKPVSADVYDTGADYKKERVSYGSKYSGISHDWSLLDGTSFEFENNKLTKVK